MDSLVGYGSDDENEIERFGAQVSVAQCGGARRRDDDTNYDDVNMDMSEESQGGESEPELPPAVARAAHGTSPPRNGRRTSDEVRSRDRSRERDRDSNRSRSSERRDRRSRAERSERSERGERRERSDRRSPHSDRRSPRSDRRSPRSERRSPRSERRSPRTERRSPRNERRSPRNDRRSPRSERRSPRSERRSPRRDDRHRDRSSRDSREEGRGSRGEGLRRTPAPAPAPAPVAAPALCTSRPPPPESRTPPAPPAPGVPARDSRDAVSPRFTERERERDNHWRDSADDWRSAPRARAAPYPQCAPSASGGVRRASPPGPAEFRPSSYKVNRKLEVMEKMGLQIKTPDGSMATAQQLRAAAGAGAGDAAEPQPGGGAPRSALPSYYNPTAVNANKILDQVQKRKLLWSNKSKREAEEAAKWSGARFAQDSDGRQVHKFMRLMGIKEPEALQSAPAAPSEDPVKKQEELFQAMQVQYEVARATTHTMRGVGLGFQRGPL